MTSRSISSRHYAAPFIAALTGYALLAPLRADPASAAPKAAVFDVEKLARIDDYFNNEVATGKIPGAMVLIKQHGQQIYLKTFGVSNPDSGRPMTPDTIFPLHSMTKTITSFVAMMLVDQGKLKIGDPVSKYIPSFAKMKVGVQKKGSAGRPVLALVPPRRPLTIEDLLLHTSGIT